MSAQSILCIVVDRLHAGMIGAYGNRWVRTPHLDRLATQSFLFDQAYITSPRLEDVYRSLWQGESRAANGPSPSTESFPALIRHAGLRAVLLTDEQEVLDHPLAQEFAQQVFIEPADATETAGDVAETRTFALFRRAIEQLDAITQPFCLWIHARGMAGIWNAPLELRTQFADPDDPATPTFVRPPNFHLKENYDPDELLGITHAYAGQVALVDRAIGELLEHLGRGELGATTQLTFMSARGFPLGEHLRVGPCDEPLHGELIQIPWLMRFPGGLGALARSQALVCPADLPGALLEWLGIGSAIWKAGGAPGVLDVVRDECEAIRDHLIMAAGRESSEDEKAVRTPAWFLRQSPGVPAELYAKPSDRWEVNDVARLCPEIVAGLQAVIAQSEDASSHPSQPPLAEILVTEVD